MARKVFYSFHYVPDNWRAAQVRNIWAVEWNKPASDNDREEVKKWWDESIQKWIDDSLKWRSCTIVLIWENTAWRKWINYEIKESRDNEKWIVWIYIHNLKNKDWEQANKGKNPFDSFTVWEKKEKLSSIVKAYNPPYTISTNVYNYIKENIEDWIEEAIDIRENYWK